MAKKVQKIQSVTLKVTIILSGGMEANENNISEIAENVAGALKHAADTCGLAPENSDVYTTSVWVEDEIFDIEANRSIG